jgi:hypothetical protein
MLVRCHIPTEFPALVFNAEVRCFAFMPSATARGTSALKRHEAAGEVGGGDCGGARG